MMEELKDVWAKFVPEPGRRHLSYEGEQSLLPELGIVGWLRFARAFARDHGRRTRVGVRATCMAPSTTAVGTDAPVTTAAAAVAVALATPQQPLQPQPRKGSQPVIQSAMRAHTLPRDHAAWPRHRRARGRPRAARGGARGSYKM